WTTATLGAYQPMRAAQRVAHPADPGEVELALEIVSARQGLSGHRKEHSLEAYPVARGQEVARRADVDSQVVWLQSRIEPWKGVGCDDGAPSPVERADIDDIAGDRDGPQPVVEHRRCALS